MVFWANKKLLNPMWHNPIDRLGINFGAPGAKTSDSGTLWLRHCPSMAVYYKQRITGFPIQISPEKPDEFYVHAVRVKGKGLKWVAGSGATGIESVKVLLKNKANYTVRLHFMEPEKNQPGQRIFSVTIQGKTVLKDFDVYKEAGGQLRSVVREFKIIAVDGDLIVTLSASKGKTLLCGIELIAETD